jgi:hypothetical protein
VQWCRSTSGLHTKSIRIWDCNSTVNERSARRCKPSAPEVSIPVFAGRAALPQASNAVADSIINALTSRPARLGGRLARNELSGRSRSSKDDERQARLGYSALRSDVFLADRPNALVASEARPCGSRGRKLWWLQVPWQAKRWPGVHAPGQLLPGSRRDAALPFAVMIARSLPREWLQQRNEFGSVRAVSRLTAIQQRSPGSRRFRF